MLEVFDDDVVVGEPPVYVFVDDVGEPFVVVAGEFVVVFAVVAVGPAVPVDENGAARLPSISRLEQFVSFVAHSASRIDVKLHGTYEIGQRLNSVSHVDLQTYNRKIKPERNNQPTNLW